MPCPRRSSRAAQGVFSFYTYVFVLTPLSFVSNFSLSKKLKGRSLRRFEGYSKKRSAPGYGGRDEPKRKTSRWPLAWLSPARPPASLLRRRRRLAPGCRGHQAAVTYETTREREQMPAGAIIPTLAEICGDPTVYKCRSRRERTVFESVTLSRPLHIRVMAVWFSHPWVPLLKPLC